MSAARRRIKPRRLDLSLEPADPLESLRDFLETRRHVSVARAKIIMRLLGPFFLNDPESSLTPDERSQLEKGELSPELGMKLLDRLNGLIDASGADLPVPVERGAQADESEPELPVPVKKVVGPDDSSSDC